MAEAKHTPGPWEIDGTGCVIRTKIGVNERGGMTGGVFVAQFFGNGLPSGADARLIAAAPTMYEYIAKRAADGDSEATQIMGGFDANT